MKYLCLIYSDEQACDAMPKQELDAITEECMAYSEQLSQSGHYIGGQALQSARSATTLRVRNGKVSVTDGPYAETKEQLGGFYMIEARDLNEAIQIASKIPPARIGTVEVRPLLEEE